MLDGGGGGGTGAMYAVQIESLEQFQQRLTAILQNLEQDNAVMSMRDGSGIFGDFPEAKSFSTAYEKAKQDLIDSFNEVTRLVNTMINVVGANAGKYKQTEQDITAKFNAILQQYGDTPTIPSTPSTTTATIPPQNTQNAPTTNSGPTYATQSSPNTTTTKPSSPATTSAGAA